MPNLKRSPFAAAALGLAVGFAIYKLIGYLYLSALMAHYKSYIPSSFESAHGVFAGDRSGGFLEGCGVAVFSLSERTSTDISTGGLAFLNETSRGTQHQDRQYQSWRRAPIQVTVFQTVARPDAGGNVCAEVPDTLAEDILSAARGSDAFHSAFDKNTEVIVIPGLRLAVFSHDR